MRKSTVKRQRELEYDGWELKSEHINTIRPHAGKVSPFHYHVKAELCRIVANQEGNSFYTEAPLGSVATDADKADVLLFRESTHRKALVVELESDYSKEKRKEKQKQYLTDTIQEVIVLDPQDAPIRLPDIEAWVRSELEGFL